MKAERGGEGLMSIIPKATAKRLPLYYRYLNFLKNTSKTSISSRELSNALQIDSATIRRDFSYLGATGKRGSGYNVTSLTNVIRQMLRQNHLSRVALVGVGNIGRALLNYNFELSNDLSISAAFDVNPEIIGTVQNNIPIYSMDELGKRLTQQHLDIAILSVPANVAQSVTDQMVAANIRGIMNFSPVRLIVPKNVRVLNIDLASELESLIYFLGHYETN